jgi:hypothetical protein
MKLLYRNWKKMVNWQETAGSILESVESMHEQVRIWQAASRPHPWVQCQKSRSDPPGQSHEEPPELPEWVMTM